MILINQRYIRGHVNRAGSDLFLKLVLAEWDGLRLEKNATVSLVTDEHEGSYRILSSIRCPGGESEAWAILRPTGPLPKEHPPAVEVRVAYAVRFDHSPTLQA